MSDDAQVQVVAFQRHRDHLRDVARTEAEAQDALHGMHDAVALGQLGRRRMVTKEEVIEAVQAFKSRGSTWKTESASALGDCLMAIITQLKKPALPEHGGSGRSASNYAPTAAAVTASSNDPEKGPAQSKPAASTATTGGKQCTHCYTHNSPGATACSMCGRVLPGVGGLSVISAASSHRVRQTGHTFRQALAARRAQGGRACCKVLAASPMCIFFFVFFAIWYGVVMAVVVASANSLATENASKDWDKGTCTILGGSVKEGTCDDDGGCTYFYQASVTLRVSGRLYTTTACRYASCAATDRSDADSFAAGFEVGNSYSCWYDDNDPNSVKLSEGTAPSWGSYLGIGVGFLFGVIPCICFGKVIKKLCRRRGL